MFKIQMTITRCLEEYTKYNLNKIITIFQQETLQKNETSTSLYFAPARPNKVNIFFFNFI